MTNLISARTISLAVAAMSLIAIAAPAAAQTEEGALRVTVSYADLDISRASGAKVLLGRIEHASVEACGGAPSGGFQLRQRPQMDAFNQCRTSAVNEAVASIHSPILTAMVTSNAKPELLASR